MSEIHENQIKSLAEFCVIGCINSTTITNQLNSVQQLKLLSRGGDALNYYFNDFTPTHDWDLGLVTIINGDFNLDQKEFNQRVEILQTIGKYFATSLTQYFSVNVINTTYKNIKFNFSWANSRLAHILFNYVETKTNVNYTNSIIDIYIHDNVLQGVTNQYVPKTQNVVYNDSHWFQKLQQTQNITFQQLIDIIPNHTSGLKITLFPNKIETIVQDITTKITYISPGDLFIDTLIMVYKSIYNINVDPRNNKLVKYMKKLSKLIDLFNNIGICPNTTCKYNITSRILSRDTNSLDCFGQPLQNSPNFKTDVINKLKSLGWLNITDPVIINLMSSKKLCEIMYVLSL